MPDAASSRKRLDFWGSEPPVPCAVPALAEPIFSAKRRDATQCIQGGIYKAISRQTPSSMPRPNRGERSKIAVNSNRTRLKARDRSSSGTGFPVSESLWRGWTIRYRKSDQESSEVENTAWSCLHDDIALKKEAFKNPSYKQCLMTKVRSRLRVICATPVGKRAAPSASTRFLCCVCISHQ
jgi:hypothetical protein